MKTEAHSFYIQKPIPIWKVRWANMLFYQAKRYISTRTTYHNSCTPKISNFIT